MAITLLCGTVGQRCDALPPAPQVSEDQPSLVLAFKPEKPPWLSADETSSDGGEAAHGDLGAPSSSDGTWEETSARSTKAAWIRRADTVVAERFGRIDAFMWFNFEKERDWRVDSSPAALQAFRQSWAGLAAGVFLPDFPGSDGFNASAIADYEARVGAHQARVGWHVALTRPFPAEAVSVVQQRGSVPTIVWEPYDPNVAGETARSGESRLDDIVAGAYDGWITAWAEGAAANGGPIEITFGHEMNGDWHTWGCLDGHNGNTPERFVQAYRHVWALFEAAGASNVRWVWTINASWRDDFTAAFPGPDYVDRLGINGFNFGGDPGVVDSFWEGWREFDQIFGCWDPGVASCFSSYEVLAALADRPIIIGEFASAEGELAPAAGE